MPTPPALIPILAGVAAGGASTAGSLLMKPDGPPELSPERKKALGSFAERLAAMPQPLQPRFGDVTFQGAPQGATPRRRLRDDDLIYG